MYSARVAIVPQSLNVIAINLDSQLDLQSALFRITAYNYIHYTRDAKNNLLIKLYRIAKIWCHKNPNEDKNALREWM